MNHSSLLKGLRVLDLSSVLAGPSVGTFFSELGAEVIKIESPNGDVTRTWFSSQENTTTTSAYYLSVNAGKSIQTLDLKHDRQALEQHLASADIVIMNFKPGDEIKFDVQPTTLLQRHPGLIIGKIKGFENEENRVAYDVAIQAETGYMSINGEKDSTPLKLPVAFMDVLAAHQLKEGILCALIEKSKTGKGMIVECSLENAGIVSLMNQGSNYLKTGNIPKASGSLHPNIAPYGEQLVFKDNTRIVLAIGSDKQFESLCDTLNCSVVRLDERFKNNLLRVENRIILHEQLQSSANHLNFFEIRESLVAKNIPFGEIKSIDKVMRSAAAANLMVQDENSGRSIAHIGFKLIK